jgi:hypothetical protein
MTVIEATYRCATCNEIVPSPTNERPVEMLSASSGHANEWVVTVGGLEIHRCSFPAPGPAPRIIRMAA